MSLEYLLLPRLQVQAANAQAAWWLVNAAPVVAASLFAHNLGRQTGPFPVAVGIIHHHAQILGDQLPKSWRFHPQQRRGAVYIDGADYSSKNKYALSLQPTVSCHLNWSLLLAYDSGDGLPGTRKLEAFLARARLAGGQVISHATPQALENREAVSKTVRSGYWLIERQDLMAGRDDPLDALIHATTHRASKTDALAEAAPDLTPDSNAEDAAVWIVPATLGYAPITEFARRAGAREGYPHAYAEPLVGLVQYLSVHQHTAPTLPLWRHTWLDHDVFIVTQKEL